MVLVPPFERIINHAASCVSGGLSASAADNAPPLSTSRRNKEVIGHPPTTPNRHFNWMAEATNPVVFLLLLPEWCGWLRWDFLFQNSFFH
ncbi:hypothetical protein CEXT_96021 [Caerostris extrusa]|uniref:Uncharacterized protein n=1 Tax=Caerostris extrusa TaxID=172846 RepID=A0AAV4W3N2_CAEEX|nr:hypothetical protein CEXT_96021 [Caerostris extrusa]